MVIPPGAVPKGLSPRGVQDVITPPPRPLAIRPLGLPPPEPPDGIDENQARAALRGGKGAGGAGGDVAPLAVVTIDSAPPSAYAARRGEIVVGRRDGARFTWAVTIDRWPALGSTAWATPVGEENRVRLVLPTPAGDVVVVEPHEAARPAQEDPEGARS